ncbi:hypothetical protein DOY81_010602, partial [Sarcophaga bullata]
MNSKYFVTRKSYPVNQQVKLKQHATIKSRENSNKNITTTTTTTKTKTTTIIIIIIKITKVIQG